MISPSFSFFRRLANAVPAAAALGAAALLGACATGAPQTPPAPVQVVQPTPAPQPVAPAPIEPVRPERVPTFDTGITPPHMRDRDIVRAAVLLPLSHSNAAVRREASSMLNAAELGLFERGGERLLLIPKDTGGTRSGAEAAARAALEDGADVLIGPLFAQAVSGAGGVARAAGVPVLAFSTDRTVAGRGVYLLSFAPEPAVKRTVAYAAQREGVRAIALLGEDTEFSRRVADVLRETAAEGGPMFYGSELYPANAYDQATFAIERLAQAFASGQFQALYISDSGDTLRELASVMRANGVTAEDLLILGPDSWRNDPNIASVSTMRGAIAPGPDQTDRAAFDSAYEAAYDSDPSQLASLAYDAVALASQLNGTDSDWDIIENPNGYLGAAGLFRLPSEGVADRGLAMYRLTPAGFTVAEPAPARFDLGF